MHNTVSWVYRIYTSEGSPLGGFLKIRLDVLVMLLSRGIVHTVRHEELCLHSAWPHAAGPQSFQAAKNVSNAPFFFFFFLMFGARFCSRRGYDMPRTTARPLLCLGSVNRGGNGWSSPHAEPVGTAPRSPSAKHPQCRDISTEGAF